MADLKFCAHYPFTDEARSWVREHKLNLDDQALADGEERLRQVLDKREGSIRLPASDLEAEYPRQIASYAASRLILAAWKNRYAQGHMAVAEAKRTTAYLNSSAEQKAGYVEKLAASLGLAFRTGETSPSSDAYLIPFYQYLPNTPRDVPYKLVNRSLNHGLVRVSDHQRLRILEESVRKRLESAMQTAPKELPPGISDAIKRLEPLLPRLVLAPTHIDAKDFPPCIKKLMEDLSASINVPHHGRLALATYLIKAGLSDEQIAALFVHAPDYNAETTTYQVAFIRKKDYSMPSCATMDTWGICIARCGCFSPIKFRDAMHGRNARESMKETGSEEEKHAPGPSNRSTGADEEKNNL